MNLTVIRIKPNPAGKDRLKNTGATAAQLAAEWVDVRNDGATSVSLHGVSLWHRAYDGASWTYKQVATFSLIVGSGEIVRVHSGRHNSQSAISVEVRNGAHHHVFTGRDQYVWNNREGDEPLLFVGASKETVDRATYDPHPPEGIVLIRQGTKLIALAKAASW